MEEPHAAVLIVEAGTAVQHPYIHDGAIKMCLTSWPGLICSCGSHRIQWPADYPIPAEKPGGANPQQAS